jgi:hypothetical protein
MRSVVDPTRSVKRIVAVPVCEAPGSGGIDQAVYLTHSLRGKTGAPARSRKD